MQANSEPPKQSHDDALPPLSFESWESRGGTAWLVTGVCTLALAVSLHLKLESVARARAQAGEQAAAPSKRGKVQPKAPAPAAASGAAELHTDGEPSTPPDTVKSEAQPELLPEQSPANTTAAALADTTTAGAPKPKLARKSRRDSAELQSLRHAFTVAANLGQPVAPETTRPVDSPAPQTLGPAEAPSEVSPPAAAPAPAPAPAPAHKPVIPDNPY